MKTTAFKDLLAMWTGQDAPDAVPDEELMSALLERIRASDLDPEERDDLVQKIEHVRAMAGGRT